MATNIPKNKNAPRSLGGLATGERIVLLSGLFFVYIAAGGFGLLGMRLYRADPVRGDWITYIPELILCGISLFIALIGVSLLRSGGLSASAPGPVINPKEWEMLCNEVKAGKEEAVTQYIRLTSLTGFTGWFTKLGLGGLPLATIGLTIFFSLLFFQNEEFLDLAKLTLGAFIGSFVQKQVGTSQSGGVVQLPTGEQVRVRPSAPPPPA